MTDVSQEARDITPGETQVTALWQCTLAGLLVAWLAIEALNFWFPYALMFYVKVPLAFLAFVLTAFSSYFLGLKNVPPRKRGVRLFLGGIQESRFYGEGDHFFFPILNRLIVTYGPTELIPYTVKPDAPEAKDKIRVIIGKDRRAVIQMRVTDPVRYIAAKKPGITLESSFLDQLRKFINQMEYAVGIVDEKSVVDRFLELPPEESRLREYDEFYKELINLRVLVNKPANREPTDSDKVPVFSEPSAKSIRKLMGQFRREASLLGITVDNVFAPSIDLPEGISRAAEAKQIQREENEALESRMGAIKKQAEQLVGLKGMDGPDALDRIGLALDQKITREVRHEKHEYPGIPEAIVEGASAFANAWAGKKTTKTTTKK